MGFLSLLVSIRTLEVLLNLLFHSDRVLFIHLEFLISNCLRCFCIRKRTLFWRFLLVLWTVVRLPIKVQLFALMTSFVAEIVLVPEIYWHLISDQVVDWWTAWRPLQKADLVTITFWLLLMQVPRPFGWASAHILFKWWVPIQVTVHFELDITCAYHKSSELHLNGHVITLAHKVGCKLEYHVNYCLCNLRWAIPSGIGNDLPVEFHWLNCTV